MARSGHGRDFCLGSSLCENSASLGSCQSSSNFRAFWAIRSAPIAKICSECERFQTITEVSHSLGRKPTKPRSNRAVEFIKRNAKAGKPFFAYVSSSLVRMPVLRGPDFVGKTGNGIGLIPWPKWITAPARYSTPSSKRGSKTRHWSSSPATTVRRRRIRGRATVDRARRAVASRATTQLPRQRRRPHRPQ